MRARCFTISSKRLTTRGYWSWSRREIPIRTRLEKICRTQECIPSALMSVAMRILLLGLPRLGRPAHGQVFQIMGMIALIFPLPAKDFTGRNPTIHRYKISLHITEDTGRALHCPRPWFLE